MKALEVYCAVALVALAAVAQPRQNQVTFGLTTGQQLSQEPAAPLHGARTSQGGATRDTHHQSSGTPSDDAATPPPASEAADRYALALSLLDTVTAHASPPPPTPYSPHLVATSSPLDRLESRLAGTYTGRALAAVRARTRALYAGNTHRRAPGARDYSVRGAVRALKGVVESFALDKVSSPAAARGRRNSKDGGNGWKERIAGAGLKGAVVLDSDEVAEGMKEVLQLTREAGEKGSAEAFVLLGDLYLTGHLSVPSDPAQALDAYTQASERYGSPEAQYKLGFLYSSNYGAALGGLEGKGQQGSALLHYTFAALSGHTPASMTVGYRHWAGIGTKQSCKDALPWYKSAADAAVRAFNAGPPGGRHLPPHKIRLSDLEGGVFGPGASSARSSLVTGGSNAQTQHEWDDLVEFHLFHAERADPEYMYRLGRLYYQGFGAGGQGGTRGLPRGRLVPVAPQAGGAANDGLWDGGRDFHRASKWFLRLAKKVWPGDARDATTDPKARAPRAGEPPRVGYYDAARDKRSERVDEHAAMVGGLAAGYLGRMYLRGEGVAVNYAKAFLWFQRGIKQGDRESSNGLGIMYRDGLGVERDIKKALLLFHAAAQQDLAEAQVNLGKYHFGLGEFAVATTYFEAAIRIDGKRWPDTFQAYYYLAELAARSAAASDNCPVAVSFYKRVAERGDWDHEVWWEAERAREKGDRRTALLGYWIMAERGYEAAQNNVAWILDRDKQRFRHPLLDAASATPSPASKQLDRLALTYWTRSAAQDNVDALVKMGDYYFSGLGTEDGVPQREKAAGCYQSAATTRFSAMSMWNLGWMHETGQGLPQDFHLAKRHYDAAYDTSADAALPATLSLIGLYTRALYYTLFKPGGDDLNALSLFGKEQDVDGVGAGYAEHGLWSFGRAWRDIQRSWGVDPGPEPEVIPAPQRAAPAMPAAGGAGRERDEHGDALREPEAQYERLGGGVVEGQRRDVRAAQRALEGAEDPLEWREYQDGRGFARGHEEDEEDEFYLEDEGDFGGTVAIVALCMLLAWLLYFRQRPAEHQPRQPAAPVPAAAPAAQPLAPQQPAPTPTPTRPAPGPLPDQDSDGPEREDRGGTEAQ